MSLDIFLDVFRWDWVYTATVCGREQALLASRVERSRWIFTIAKFQFSFYLTVIDETDKLWPTLMEGPEEEAYTTQPADTVMDGGLPKAGWPPMESAGSRGSVLEIEDLHQDPGSEVLQPDNSREWEITALWNDAQFVTARSLCWTNSLPQHDALLTCLMSTTFHALPSIKCAIINNQLPTSTLYSYINLI